MRLREKNDEWLIDLGPKNPRTGEIEAKATFRRSEKDKRNAYAGPDGGTDQAFVRLENDGDKTLGLFLAPRM